LLTGEYPFGVFLDAAVNVKTKNRSPWPKFMTSNRQLAPLALQLQAIVENCLNYDPAARPTALDITKQCQDLCYLSVEREIGTVQNLIQNNYSGFAHGPNETVFFSMAQRAPTRQTISGYATQVLQGTPNVEHIQYCCLKNDAAIAISYACYNHAPPTSSEAGLPTKNKAGTCRLYCWIDPVYLIGAAPKVSQLFSNQLVTFTKLR
jgi:hypothetical protein